MTISKETMRAIAWRATVASVSLVFPRAALAQPAPAAPAPAPPAPAAPAPGAPAPAAPAPAPPAQPAEAPATAAPAPAAAAPAPVAAAPPEAAAPPPAPPAEAKPADEPPKEEEWKPPSIDVGAWIRVGLQFTSTRTAKIDDTQMDSAYGELHLGGKVHPNVSYTLNFNANGAGGTPTAGLLDAIVGLDFIDELHLWAGQLLTPVDRSNFSGPFFMSPWSYPGIMSAGGTTVFITPNGETTFGRDVGTVLWGDVMKGMFKYYLAVTHLRPVTDSPLLSGRLAFAAIGKEPGYYGSSTYYGDQDILAIGVGGQYQNDGTVSPGTPGDPAAVPPVPATPTLYDKYGEVNADVLAEFKIGEAGVITGEGAFYHYEGDYNLADNQFFLLASYLSPPVGPGKIQPLVRYQNAKKEGIDAMWQFDGQVAYVVKGASMRGLLGFSHTDLVGIEGNLFQIGLQTIMF